MTSESPRLTVVGIYPWWTFWALGEGRGSPSFYLSPKGFVNAGHRMIIVQPRRDNPPGRAEYRGIELVRYRGGPYTIIEDTTQSKLRRVVSRNWIYWQYQVAAFVAGVRVCRREKPDALIAYGDHSTPVTWLLGKLFGTPTVNRLFGTFLNRYLEGGPFTRLKLLYHYIQVLGLKVPASYTVLCDDGSEGDRVAAALGVDPERFRFWRNGSDHSRYDPDVDVRALRERLGLPQRGTLLFNISRLHREKRNDRIIAALPMVLERHPDTRLVLIGSGEDRDRLETEAHRLGVDHAIIWTGSIDQENLGDYINACDVFVAMSDRTNAANPLFEACLSGKPPVVLNTGGTGRAITHGVNGWLVPEANPEALGPMLLEILADPDRVAEVGRAALEWARANVPTIEGRQRMEVDIVEQAVREHRARKGLGDRDLTVSKSPLPPSSKA